LMAIVSDQFNGLSLRNDAHFIALEGSNTFSCGFKNVFVPDEFILAAPCEDYVARIRPGFILTQVGMGLGLVASCIELMKRANRRLHHVNCFLDDQVGDIEEDAQSLRLKTYALAEAITAQDSLDNTLLREVIQARIAASELSLRASNAAMLHAGARAYLQGSVAERKLRESYFVAIVTPALKHLKKMLYGMSEAGLN
jgi:alkylation response protein AidB-like acyl-CoA dehydrogenase